MQFLQRLFFPSWGPPRPLARLVIYSKQGILSPKRGYDEDPATSRTATHGPNDVPRPGPTALRVLGLGFYPSRAAGWEKVPHRVQRWSAVERTRRHTDTHSYQHTGCLWLTATFPTINTMQVIQKRTAVDKILSASFSLLFIIRE